MSVDVTPLAREMALPTNSIERALLTLSDRDPDHAGERNGIGFNARDTDFGNSLADQVRAGRTLTPRQAFAAHRMLGTYREQLASAGIDYGAIPLPTTPPPKVAQRTIDLDTDAEAFAVAFPFDAALLTAIKAMPDRGTWNATLRVWMIPWSDDNTMALAAFVERYHFTATTAALDLLSRSAALTETARAAAEEMIESSMAAAAELEIPGLGGELRPFQKAGVKYALAQKRTYIADEMGLGKTIQALAVIHAANAYPAVVVVPASLKENWRREARKWLPGKRIGVLKGRAPTDNSIANMLFSLDVSADVLIVNYEILGTWVPTLRARGPQAIVFDESHYLKTSGTHRTKAARELAKDIPTILMLTGTPVLNRPAELITQLAVMNRLADLGGYKAFKAKYVDAYQPNLKELNDRLRSVCYIRRLKSQVLTELPAKQRTVIPIDLDNRQEYDNAERDLIEYLRGVDLEKAERAMWAEQLVKISVLKQLAAKGKMAAAAAWIEDFLETGEKLVVFGWHQSIVRELASRFSCDMIIGGQNDMARDAIVQAFQNDPAKRLLVCNIQAGGLGLTLTAASNVAKIELGWNMATHVQAEDRVHRIGQQDAVNAYYLIAPRTIDERIWRLLEAKAVVVNATTEGRMDTGGSILPALIADLIATPEEE